MLSPCCNVCGKPGYADLPVAISSANFPLEISLDVIQVSLDKRKKTEPVHLCRRHLIKELKEALKAL